MIWSKRKYWSSLPKPSGKVDEVPLRRVYYSTGEIMCLVDVPATDKVVKKEVVVQPHPPKRWRFRPNTPPSKKKVLVSLLTIKKIKVPAVYKTVKVHNMTAPSEEKRIQIPGEYQMVKRTEKVSEGSTDCAGFLETNRSPDLSPRSKCAGQSRI